MRILLFLLSSLLVAQPVPNFDRIYVFGDSYSDTGAGYVDGNGPTAVAYMAAKMGLRLLPPADPAVTKTSSLNFAVSGAQSGEGKGRRVGEKAFLGYGMRNQVDDFAAKVKAGAIAFTPDTTLFFLAGGLNDRRLPDGATVANLTGLIRTLHGLGGRHFRVAVLPEQIPEFAEVGKRLNPEIARIPALVRAGGLTGVQIRLSNWGRFLDEVRANPSKYGIANLTDACAGRAIFNQDATPCRAPETHFYYHAGHPSTAVHKAAGAMLYEELIGQPGK
jgi:phospholipase/lecithinase/hemolysin